MVVKYFKGKFQLNSLVRYNGREGVVRNARLVSTNGLFDDYVIYYVEFEDLPAEWINERYLVKV